MAEYMDCSKCGKDVDIFEGTTDWILVSSDPNMDGYEVYVYVCLECKKS